MIPIKTQGGFLLTRIRNLSGRIFERMLKQSGIEAFNGPQGRILYVLWERGEMTITEIGRLTGLAKTTLTSMLDRMEAQHLLTRTPDPHNRRQIIIRLTDVARGYREEYDSVSEQANEVFYKGFSVDEIRAFERTLLRIIENLEEAET